MLKEFVDQTLGFDVSYAMVYPSGLLWFDLRDPRKVAIFPGAFNPLHEAHRELAWAAHTYLGREVMYELSIENADKGHLGYEACGERLSHFQRDTDVVILTRAPLFLDKARLFPGTTFVVGYDTAERIVNPSYGPVEEILQGIEDLGCSFVVGRRSMNGELKSLRDAHIPDRFIDMFYPIPSFLFPGNPLSSTQIRNGLV